MGTETFEVEVIHRQNGKQVKFKHTVRVNPKDSFKKIKGHFAESLGIKGKLMYGNYDCDAKPLEKLLEQMNSSRKEKFYLITEQKLTQKLRGTTQKLRGTSKKLRGTSQKGTSQKLRGTTQNLKGSTKDSELEITLQSLDGARRVMKISKQITIRVLKHKIQDQYGIPAEEQTIYRLGQQKEIPVMTIMQLMKQPINLVVLTKGESPPKQLRPAKPPDEKNRDPIPGMYNFFSP